MEYQLIFEIRSPSAERLAALPRIWGQGPLALCPLIQIAPARDLNQRRINLSCILSG